MCLKYVTYPNHNIREENVYRKESEGRRQGKKRGKKSLTNSTQEQLNMGRSRHLILKQYIIHCFSYNLSVYSTNMILKTMNEPSLYHPLV